MYMVGRVLGVGSYGKVRLAWHRLTARRVAIKTYEKAALSDEAHWKRVMSEVRVMERLSHPRLSRMFECIETPRRVHIVMDCVEG